MTTMFTPRPLSRRCRVRPVAANSSPAGNRRSVEIDETARQAALEQAVRKATAQLRRSVKPPNPPEDGLYSPLSGRHVSPSVGGFFTGRISRCHQQI